MTGIESWVEGWSIIGKEGGEQVVCGGLGMMLALLCFGVVRRCVLIKTFILWFDDMHCCIEGFVSVH